jgi:hypothetical protein
MGIVVALLIWTWKVVLWLAEAVFWLLYGISVGWKAIRSLLAAQRVIREGQLLCPRGHPIPVDGGPEMVIECKACGFCWDGEHGTILQCPHCGSSTPHVRCPVCSLSSPNPMIFS